MLRCVRIWDEDGLQPIQYAGLAGCCTWGNLTLGCGSHLHGWHHGCAKEAHHSSLGGSSSRYGSLNGRWCGRIRGARGWLWGGGWACRQNIQQDLDRSTLARHIAQAVEGNDLHIIDAQWSNGVIPEAAIPFKIQWETPKIEPDDTGGPASLRIADLYARFGKSAII